MVAHSGGRRSTALTSAPSINASEENQWPGAASSPLPSAWRRRQPESTVLHGVVREHLQTFLEEARERSEQGLGLPRFVAEEFERYLDCGVAQRCFACRARCRTIHRASCRSGFGLLSCTYFGMLIGSARTATPRDSRPPPRRPEARAGAGAR